jgi:hypothetical protein
VRLSEAPGFGLPITVYDPKSKGAESYRSLAREVALRPPPDTPMPSYEELPTVMPVQVMTGDPEPEPEPLAEPETVWEPEPRQAVEAEPEQAVDPEPEPKPEHQRPPGFGSEQTEARAGPEPQVEAETPAPSAAPPLTARPPASPGPPSQADEIWDDLAPSEPRVRAPRSPEPPGTAPTRHVVVIDDDIDVMLPPAGGENGETGASDVAGPIGRTLEDEPGTKRRWRLFRKGGE